MAITITYVIGLGLCGALIFSGKTDLMMGIAGLLALAVRICWIVTIPIVYHRLNLTYTTAE